VNLKLMTRELWIMFMDIIGPLAMSEPAPIDAIYGKLLAEKDRLNLDLSYGQFLKVLEEMERRGIIRTIKKDDKTYIALTDEARYFLITYSPAWIGL